MNKFRIGTKYPANPADNTPLYYIARKAEGDKHYREMDGTTTASLAVAEALRAVLVKRQELAKAEAEHIRLMNLLDAPAEQEPAAEADA